MTKKERVSLENRATKGKAALVLRETRNGTGLAARGTGCQEIAGIESITLIKPVSAPMELVRAGFGGDLHLRTGIASKFRIEVVRDELEFLYAIKTERA